MNPSNARVLVTGAAGGIGSSIARRLAETGVKLSLTDFRAGPLDDVADELRATGADVTAVAADVTSAAGRDVLVEHARRADVGTLINVAGVNPFGLFAQQGGDEIERTMLINSTAPILLCRALIPVLERHARARIVNVGSIFGSLAYPGFAVYSASKFALRGFTEALRRELAGSGISVHYVAPRATRTPLLTDRVRALNEELGVAMDPPEAVAQAVAAILERGRREVYLGLAERIFVKVNAILPGLVDRAIRTQLPVIRRHADQPAKVPEPGADTYLPSASTGAR